MEAYRDSSYPSASHRYASLYSEDAVPERFLNGCQDFPSELTVTHPYVPRHQGFTFTNGIQLSHVEVHVETGFVKLLKHWVVEDCGRIINPRLVDEQLRGAIVQGIGAALFKQCVPLDRHFIRTVPSAMLSTQRGPVRQPTAQSEGFMSPTLHSSPLP